MIEIEFLVRNSIMMHSLLIWPFILSGFIEFIDLIENTYRHSTLHCTVRWLVSRFIWNKIKNNPKLNNVLKQIYSCFVCVCVNFRCCFKSLLSKIQLLSTLKKLQQSIHQNRLFYFTLIWAFFITFLFFSLSLSLFELITFHGSERRGKKIYEKKAKKKEEKKQAIEHNEQYKF